MISALDMDWQIYLLGWFSCLMSAMPVMILWIICTVDFSEENSANNLQKSVQKLQTENELLKQDNIFCRQLIGNLLEDKVNDICKGVK